MNSNVMSTYRCVWIVFLLGMAGLVWAGGGNETPVSEAFPKPTVILHTPKERMESESFDILKAKVKLNHEALYYDFQMELQGRALAAAPAAIGSMDGAPVLAYVFPTDLKSTDVGFSKADGVVALAVTSHPDFDDTPLWDEDGDGVTNNLGDGVRYHSHWVILVPDERNNGNLSVKEFQPEDNVVLPPTNPGMPMFMDSPGFQVSRAGNTLSVLVPKHRIVPDGGFQFDAVSVYMEVRPGGVYPLLSVYEVLDILSGDLSLPYSVAK